MSRPTFSLRALLSCIGLLSVSLGSLVDSQSDTGVAGFWLMAFTIPALAALLALEGKGAWRAFGLGAILPAVAVPVVLLSLVMRSRGFQTIPAWPWLLPDLRFIYAGRVMAKISWPFAIGCGVVCAVVWWLIMPRRTDPTKSRD